MRRAAVRKEYEICQKNANQKQFWKTIKPFVNSRKTLESSSLIFVKENNKIIREQTQVLEMPTHILRKVQYQKTHANE